jgi:hypothetical protein
MLELTGTECPLSSLRQFRQHVRVRPLIVLLTDLSPRGPSGNSRQDFKANFHSAIMSPISTWPHARASLTASRAQWFPSHCSLNFTALSVPPFHGTYIYVPVPRKESGLTSNGPEESPLLCGVPLLSRQHLVPAITTHI